MKKTIIHYYQKFFTFSQIDDFRKDDAIIDATNGGLLLGPSHDNGGIYFLFEYNDGYRLFGEVEGYEYIINRNSLKNDLNFMKSINNINRDFIEDFAPYNYDNSILTIDAISPNPDTYNAKYIILDVRGGFAIVNKHSTKVHLSKIDFFNKRKL
ncbi:hypothetical protein [Flavobacterium beibuense]|uniref:hypothetical protein n=1 Tax=Flavobacterium beibuense TaxID=657326 RepID=UPI003A942465